MSSKRKHLNDSEPYGAEPHRESNRSISWSPGARNPAHPISVLATCVLTGVNNTFAAHVEDPGLTDDQIAASFKDFVETVDRDDELHSQSKTHQLDTQRSVPFHDQLSALSPNDEPELNVQFTKYQDGKEHRFNRAFLARSGRGLEAPAAPSQGGPATGVAQSENQPPRGA